MTKEKIKEVEEEWQSNLLNWKSKRRQSKENKNSDSEENGQDGPQRKIKTFSEILNEKAKSGHRLGYNLSRYVEGEEDGADLFTEQSNSKSIAQQNRATSENSNDSESKINCTTFCPGPSCTNLLPRSVANPCGRFFLLAKCQ